jgi:hypothetical protein
MTHTIVKTDNYLLVVDDSEIKEGDWVIENTINQIFEINDIKKSIGLCRSKVDTYVIDSCTKIAAHLPLNGSPILEGVDLLPAYEDDVIELADEWVFDINGHNWSNNDSTAGDNFGSFIAGYNKAKEKFLSELHNQILDFTHDLKQDPSQYKYFEGALFGLNRLKFYLSQYPTEFETVDEYPVITDDDYFLKEEKSIPRPKTITTAQGVQWVGKYK